MPVSRKRKNRYKAAGAKERARRVRQHNAQIRENHRFELPDDRSFDLMTAIGAIPGLKSSLGLNNK